MVINIILNGFIIVLFILFYFWINPKLNDLEKIVSMYKGFGGDYEKWKKQHDDEYKSLEQKLSQTKHSLKEIAGELGIENGEPTEIIKRFKNFIKMMDKYVTLSEKRAKLLEDRIKSLEKEKPKEYISKEWVAQLFKERRLSKKFIDKSKKEKNKLDNKSK